jgi:hypothetical protein
MSARGRKISERYAKKTLAHIEWLRTLPSLQSLCVRRRDVLRHCVLLRQMVRDAYDAPGLPMGDFLRRAQEDLVLLREVRAAAKRALH